MNLLVISKTGFEHFCPFALIQSGHTIFVIKARSDLCNSHAFTQWDREFSNCPRFPRALKLNYPYAFYAPRLNEP